MDDKMATVMALWDIWISDPRGLNFEKWLDKYGAQEVEKIRAFSGPENPTTESSPGSDPNDNIENGEKK